MANSRQFCTFYLDNHLFGIELSKVQEVILQRELTKVPLAPFVVRGLMNLRGQIVIAMDLRRQLELPERPPEKLPMSVVVRTGQDAVSLLVDEIGDVVAAGDETFEPPPETLRGTLRSAILGVHKLDKQLMHVLDTERACAMEEHSELATSDR